MQSSERRGRVASSKTPQSSVARTEAQGTRRRQTLGQSTQSLANHISRELLGCVTSGQFLHPSEPFFLTDVQIKSDNTRTI